MSDGQSLEIEGYGLCRCGRYEVAHVFARCGQRCMACFDNDVFAPVRDVELRNKNRARTVAGKSAYTDKDRARDARKRAYRAADPDKRWIHHESRRSRLRAHTRLARLFPEVYALLLAQERRSKGLAIAYHAFEFTEVVEKYLQRVEYDPAIERTIVDGAAQPPEANPPAARE